MDAVRELVVEEERAVERVPLVPTRGRREWYECNRAARLARVRGQAPRSQVGRSGHRDPPASASSVHESRLYGGRCRNHPRGGTHETVRNQRT